MQLKQSLRNIADKLPYVRTLKRKVDLYENALPVPPGHFYSPLVDSKEILVREQHIFSSDKVIHGVDLNEAEQFALLNQYQKYYKQLSFEENPTVNKRYFFKNSYYSYADAIFLFSMIMHNRPKRIVEVGSGFSSAAMLDINEEFFANSIEITFIEPYPDNLNKIVKSGDRYTLIEKKVQQVNLDLFESLQENDILFIDSTHVAKTDSDVLFEIFEILPLLKKGVKIHFHDIFYPFEYPRKWILEEKKSWNEIYFLRSFLMYNDSFKIIALNTFLEANNKQWFESHMPLCLKNTGGSCWLEKVV